MARLLLETLYSYRRQGKFRLHEFVIMPEHFPLTVDSIGDHAGTGDPIYQRRILPRGQGAIGKYD